MKTTVKIILLSLPVILLTVCTLQAEEPAAVPQVASPNETAVAPEPAAQRVMRGEEYFNDILEKIKSDNPEEGARLEKLRDENPKLFRMEIRKSARDYMAKQAGFESNQPRRQGPMGGEQPMDMRDDRESMQGMMGREKVREHMQARENEMTAWLEKNEPEKAKELAALKETDPKGYMRRMMLEMKNYRQIIDAEQANPALAEVLRKDLVLKQKRNELLEQLKGTTDEAKKKELTEQLRTVLGERFDLIVQKKQLRYEELKKKLEELQQAVNKSQAELETIKSKKAEQIEKHLQELQSQSESIDWN
ncbi:MAG: hypothetical protein WC496_11170 [Phycisphaerae bacterium]